jgi:hypothetical protein
MPHVNFDSAVRTLKGRGSHREPNFQGTERPLLASPRQRPLLASPLVLLSGEQLGFCGRGRYLLPTPGVIFDACGWAWTFN